MDTHEVVITRARNYGSTWRDSINNCKILWLLWYLLSWVRVCNEDWVRITKNLESNRQQLFLGSVSSNFVQNVLKFELKHENESVLWKEKTNKRKKNRKFAELGLPNYAMTIFLFKLTRYRFLEYSPQWKDLDLQLFSRRLHIITKHSCFYYIM